MFNISKVNEEYHTFLNRIFISTFPFYCEFFYFLLWFRFYILIFSSLNCPYEYLKSEPYISAPLLSALNSAQEKTNRISNAVFHKPNTGIESRSFYTNSDQFENSLRFASLGLAAKNIFQDTIVRRITGFVRLMKLASNIWDS